MPVTLEAEQTITTSITAPDEIRGVRRVVEDQGNSPFSRRRFIRTFALGTVTAVLSGCGWTAENLPQQSFVAGLKKAIQYDENASEEELRDFILQKTFDDTGWMTNRSIGSIETSTGRHDFFVKENGEIGGYFSTKFKYPTPDIKNISEPKKIDVGKTTIFVYGTSETKARIAKASTTIFPFLNDYFKQEEEIKTYLHLNFLPFWG